MNSQIKMGLESRPASPRVNITSETRRSKSKTNITVVVRRWRWRRGRRGGYRLELVYTKEFYKVMKLIGRHIGGVTANVRNVEYMTDRIMDGTPYDIMDVVLRG